MQSSPSPSSRPMHTRLPSQSERLLRATLARQDAHRPPFEDDDDQDEDNEFWSRNYRSPAKFLFAPSAASSPSPSPRARNTPLPPSPATKRTTTRSSHRHHQSVSVSVAPTAPLRRSNSSSSQSPLTSSAESSSMRLATPAIRPSHDAILRARLEDVLAASDRTPPKRQPPRLADTDHRAFGNEWPWAGDSPVSPGFDTLSSSSPPSSDSRPPSPTSTPPHLPTRFDVRTASIECKNKSGYVSFSDVRGLGSPPEDADDSDDASEDPQRTGFGRFLDIWWKTKPTTPPSC